MTGDPPHFGHGVTRSREVEPLRGTRECGTVFTETYNLYVIYRLMNLSPAEIRIFYLKALKDKLLDYNMVRAKNALWAFSGLMYKYRYFFLAYSIYRRMAVRGWLARRMGLPTRRHGGKKKARTKGNRKLASVSTVKRMINRTIETKFTYSAYGLVLANCLNTAPYFGLLNPLTQGDTDSNRTGDKVRFQYLTMNLFHNLANTNINDITYRIAIIRAKNPRGVAPTASTLVVNGGTAQDPCEIWDEVNYDFFSRYEVLYDSGVRVLHRNVTTNYTVATDYVSVACDFTTDYSLGNAGTIADIDQNALYLYFRSGNGTANAHALSLSYKLTYKDM